MQRWFYFNFLLPVTAGLFSYELYAAERCEEPVAQLEVIEGVVVWRSGASEWQQATIHNRFCYGDSLRVEQERAALRLANHTLVRLDENTTVTFQPEPESYWLEMLQGAAHFLTRTPMTIKTPYLNAAVEGTEFVVLATDDGSQVSVLEGKVVLSQQNQRLDLNGGETGAVARGNAPQIRRVSLPQMMDWTFYYPPVLTLDPGSESAAVTQQAQEAFAFLLAGQVELSLAKSRALSQAEPESVAALASLSYALQASGDLPHALEAISKARRLTPDSPDVMARYAELALASGNTRQARKAIERTLSIAPKNAHALSLAGFIALNEYKTREARELFTQSITNKSTNPLAYWGLSLCASQSNQPERAQHFMELAVLLDPTNSVLRSYLGQNYIALPQYEWAQTQFELAQTLDSTDPTPWFYQARLSQLLHQPLTAKEQIDKAIEKNNARAITRSERLLDSDLAARNAAKADILQSLGANQAAQQHALKTTQLNTDYAGYKALVQTSATQANQKVLRANAALLYQLLRPQGAKSLTTGTNDLALADDTWASPAYLGLNEFTALTRSQPFSFNGLLGAGNDAARFTRAQIEARLSPFTLSAGKYNNQAEGYTQNNDIETQVQEANLHLHGGDSFSLFAQHLKKTEHSGDVANSPYSEYFDEALRRDNTITTASAGGRYAVGEHILLAHAAVSDGDLSTETIVPVNGLMLSTGQSSKLDRDFYELAWWAEWSFLQLQAGFVDEQSIQDRTTTVAAPFPGIPPQITQSQFDYSAQTAYTQLSASAGHHVRWSAGISETQWTTRASGFEEKENNTDYRAAVQFLLSPAATFTLGHWRDTSNFSTLSGSLKPTQILSLDTSADLHGAAPLKTSAAQLNIDGHRNQFAALYKNTDITDHIYYEQPLPGARVQFRAVENPVNEEIFRSEWTHFVNDTVSLQLSANTKHTERTTTDRLAITNIPIEYNEQAIAVAAYFQLGAVAVFELEAADFYQQAHYIDSSANAIDTLVYNRQDDRGTVLNSRLTLDIKKQHAWLTLEALNVLGDEIEMYQGDMIIGGQSLMPYQSRFAYDTAINARISLRF